MSKPVIMRSTDPNAPVLCADGDRKCLIDMLEKCLVTGYGDTAPLGWTMPYVSGDRKAAVFRQDPAKSGGRFLKVKNRGDSQWYGIFTAWGYEMMSGIDEGTGQFPNEFSTWGASNPGGYIWTSNARYSPNTSPKPWMIIGNEKCFYLFVWHDISWDTVIGRDKGNQAFFFGDFIPFNPDDAYCQALVTPNDRHYKRGLGYLGHPNSSEGVGCARTMHAPRRADGLPGMFPLRTVWGGGPCHYGDKAFGRTGAPYDETKPLFITRPYVADAAPAYNVRGWWPGLYAPCSPTPWDAFTIVEIEDKKFIAVPFGNDTSTSYGLFDLTENFFPDAQPAQPVEQ